MIECDVITCQSNSVQTGDFKDGDEPQCMEQITNIDKNGKCQSSSEFF